MKPVEANHSREIRYRADIDGLRAIAVLLVVGFHMRVSLVPLSLVPWIAKNISHTLAAMLVTGTQGGFIGVDVFFVISGFLISGILLREQSTNTFSIVKFYERRARRILPALIGILLFVLVVGYFSFTPAEMVRLARSALAATFSAANIYFWKNSGYFEALSYPKPLLHTWSLAVEEQFYLLFPLFLLLLHRFLRKYLKVAVLLVAAASFVASVITTYKSPDAAFYLLPTRAWELLVGTILALGIVRPPASRGARNLVSLSGLALILFAACRFNESTSFPGASALIPSLGAACIILAGSSGSSLVGRLLSTWPFVFVGLISYSLYLWHWPLLLINKYEYFAGFHINSAWLFLLMLAAASLSWKFVEQPFRSGRLKLPRRQLFAVSGAAMVVISGLSVWTIAAHGFPSRLTQPELRIADYVQNGPLNHWGDGCFASAYLASIAPSCLAASSSQPNYLLFGDSHAAHLWYGLSSSLPEVHFMEATASQCKPLLISVQSSHDAFCRELVKEVLRQLVPGDRVNAIILSAAWSDADAQPLGGMVARLRSLNIKVYVVGPLMIYDQPPPNLLVRSIRSRDPALPSRHHLWSDAEYEALDDKLAQEAMENGAARYISLRELVCPENHCLLYAAPGVPLQFDQSHLTDAGSLFIGQKLRDSLRLP